MKKKIGSLLLCLCMTASMCACGGTKGWTPGENAIAMNSTFFNPIRIESQMGDPWMYKKDGYYYYCHSEGAKITLTKSKWMTQVTLNPDDPTVTTVATTEKLSGLDEFWAPEIFWFDGHWYIYATATHDGLGDWERKTHVFRAKTDDAMGEWEHLGQIMLPYNTWAIDATFMNYNNRQFIIWSSRFLYANSTTSFDPKQELYITELEQGKPWLAKSLDESNAVKIATPVESWEIRDGLICEGPVFITSPDGTPLLLYSASHSRYNNYCIGYLTLEGDPMDASAWKKCDAPLMSSDFDRGIIGPGHNSVVKSPDDSEYWICYHTAKKMGAGWDRMTRLQKLDWKDGGKTPYVEKIARFSDAVKMPSGEKTNRYRYEAEKATLTGGCTILDMTDEDEDGKFDYASGGKAVQVGGTEDKITFKVNVPENGKYIISVRYSNDSATVGTVNVTVNGTRVLLYTPQTQDKEMFSKNSFYTGLYVRADRANIVEISCDKNILIDCIVVDHLDRK